MSSLAGKLIVIADSEHPVEPGVASSPASDPPESNEADKSSETSKASKTPRPPKPLNEVVFHTYPKLLFAWPVIVAGFVFWPMVDWLSVPAEFVGWVYLFVLFISVLTISVDVERNHAFVWLLVFIIFILLGFWLSDSSVSFTFFGNIYNFFDRLDVQYNSGFGLGLSLLLSGPYLVMMLWARLNHRWRITRNEFEHYSWGRADDSLARGAKRVRSTYPDLLEFLLAGAGTLIVYSATGRSELRRIPHVPMIFLVRRRINQLLESTSVTLRDEAMLDDMEDDEEHMGRDRTDAVTEDEIRRETL